MIMNKFYILQNIVAFLYFDELFASTFLKITCSAWQKIDDYMEFNFIKILQRHTIFQLLRIHCVYKVFVTNQAITISIGFFYHVINFSVRQFFT